MPLPLPPIPASGGAALKEGAKLIIRFSRQGCTNRPFYHLHVGDTKTEPYEQCIEQLGTYDPLPNERNEKLLSCNFERIRFWLGEGATVSRGASRLAGFFPIHPDSYMQAWKNRIAAEQPEPPMPKKLTWRERKKILMKQAEEALNAPQDDNLEDKEKAVESS
ncbi:putative 28S ribosomal protein S16, mitochondrial [Frankliniella fusca]|uniref:Small ribosomal subunit protein bS16m n=1 Tax=Frankliniella fusca TaxID=407009 RepID=A0AAE1H044_9NEOP|nr:putative 28S ribosomal protein S16, mitochondrial [Frankliniella fusca]